MSDAGALAIIRDIAQFGPLGVFAALVTFWFRVEGAMKVRSAQELKMYQEIHELHDWHAAKDSDGVPVWYSGNKDLAKAVEKLDTSVNELRVEIARGNGR